MPTRRSLTVRGQYRAGFAEGAPAPSYLQDIGKEASDTETFVALEDRHRQLALGGRAVLLAHGQAAAAALLGDRVGFRRVPHAIFDTGADGIPANRLVIRVQPDEGIKLWLMIKEPGPAACACSMCRST